MYSLMKPPLSRIDTRWAGLNKLYINNAVDMKCRQNELSSIHVCAEASAARRKNALDKISYERSDETTVIG